MKRLLAYLFIVLVLNLGTTFQTKAGSAGILQYCFYKGNWSLIYKWEKNFKNNTRWCKIIKKSENPEFYNELFKNALHHSQKWWIQTNTLQRIVDKHEAIANKYKKLEEEILAKKRAEEIETNQSDDNVNIAEQLTVLIENYESGLLTKKEFEKAKKKILD